MFTGLHNTNALLSNHWMPKKMNILSAKNGYDSVAKDYDTWYWQNFWSHYEKPIVDEWIENLSGLSVLDIGVGTGRYIDTLIKKKISNIVGIDVSPKMLEICREKYIHDNIHLYNEDILDFKSTVKFDALLSCRVLNHINSLSGFFKRSKKLLNDNGKFLLSDIHPLHPYKTCGVKTESEANAVLIKTKKHSIQSIKENAYRVSFHIDFFKEYYVRDLFPKPDYTHFKKLYLNQDKPIFYIMILST